MYAAQARPLATVWLLSSTLLAACQGHTASGHLGPGEGGEGGAAPEGGKGGGSVPRDAGGSSATGGGGGGSAPDAASRTGGAGGQGGMAGQTGAGGAVTPPDPNCTPSMLYGRTGELWKADGRLIDAGWAGYHTGIDPLPSIEGPIKRVTDFGAKGDDDADDTKAFQDGIAMTDGVLLVPAGRYVISQRLDIKKSNFVLRGEGQDKSKLFFPRSLSAIYGGDWTFVGGLITASGSDAGPQLATIGSNAARGATTLQVSSAAGIKVGDWVRVVETDNGGSLFRALYGGMHPGNGGQDGGREVIHHYSPVTAVAGNSITLQRPLPFEVNTSWKPEIRAAKPTVREVGIESLTMEMMGTPYPGHFNEAGYNAIYYQGIHDSWVRDVTILNADYGVHFNRSFFCTATGVILDTNFDRGPSIGHHGLNSSGGADVVFSKFDLRKKYVHDLTVDGYAMTTVWSSGKGVDLNMDHHGRAPYGTLWTNIDVGPAGRAYGSGGSGNRMPHTGAYTTSWNLYGAGNVGFPAGDFGPLMNFYGVTGTAGSAPGHWSVENVAPDKLCQKDLYQAMVAARRAKGETRPPWP